MILRLLAHSRPHQQLPLLERMLDAEYAPLRQKLRSAGLDEQTLRRMDPDDRVAALENARLDPYDYIYLAC